MSRGVGKINIGVAIERWLLNRWYMRWYVLPLLLCWTLVGCSSWSIKEAQTFESQHSSRLSLDWPGHYIGLIPCADCPGIEMRLTLNADFSYQLQTRYHDRSEQVFEQRGVFVWQADGMRIRLLDGINDGLQFWVGEHSLWQLDRQGQKIDGVLSDQYRLFMQADNPDLMARLASMHWRVQAWGERFAQAPLVGPWLGFDAQAGRVYGHTGCNRFSGSLWLRADGYVAVDEVAVTRMACLHVQPELAWLQALRLVNRLQLSEQQLLLFNNDELLLRLRPRPDAEL